MNVPSDGSDELSERARELLRTLVEAYIRDGAPVGSRALSRESGLTLSSATVRNVMADLEELGFVTSPHTSAGRIPTDKGYRFFVNTLLRRRLPEASEVAELQRRLDPGVLDAKALVASASQALSSVTRLAGVVTVPRQSHPSLSQIEFVNLSDRRVLVILVVNGREVQNRVLQMERHYRPDELRRAANFLNEQFAGRELDEVRRQLLRQLQETREEMNQLMLDAIHIAQRVFGGGAPQPEVDVVFTGETNLMGLAELSNVDKLCGPRACRSSSDRSPGTASSTTAASSRRLTASTRRSLASSASSVRPAWPMSGSYPSSTSRPGSWARP